VKKVRITKNQLEKIVLDEQTDSTTVVQRALDYNLDIKKSEKTENPLEGRKTWDELYPNPTDTQKEQIEFIKKKFKSNYVPEILSSVTYSGKPMTSFNMLLLDIAKAIEEKTGLDIEITGGNDYYHLKRKTSRHKRGGALDFVIKGDSNSDENQKKVEKAIIDIIMEQNFPHIGFLNEFKISTGGSGGHFHISLGPPTEASYYHFINRKGEVEDGEDREYKLTPDIKKPEGGVSFDKKLNRINQWRKDGELVKVDIKPLEIIIPEPMEHPLEATTMPEKLPWKELSQLERKYFRQKKINKQKYEEDRIKNPLHDMEDNIYFQQLNKNNIKSESFKFNKKKILNEGIKESWNSLVSLARREGKETLTAIKIIKKLLSDKEVTSEEIKFLKSQSVDIAKIVGVMSLGAVSMAIPIALEKILNKWGISIMPKNQTEEKEEEPVESFKFNKKMIKEGIRNYLSNTVKDIKEKNRLKEMSNFEKQIYFYQKGYDVLDKRFKDYINDFRYYYSVVNKQELSHITNEEILRFLTKHYLKDIEPRLSGLYQHKILAHGTKDLSSLDVVDIDKFIGSGSHNPGHFGKGFYLSSDRNVARHYGATQPIVLNKVERPFYIIPGDKNYYGSHDFDGMQIRVKIDLSNLPSEAIEMMDDKSHLYNVISDGKSYNEVGYAQGIPQLDKSWKQNGINDAKKDLEHKLKTHYQIEERYIKDILDNAEIEIEPLKDFAGLTGSKTVDNVYNQGKHDLIVTNKNTSGIGNERFMDAEVAVKDPTQIVSLFPSYDIIIRSDLGSMDRDVTNPSIHSESIDHHNKSKIIYSAVVLDEDSKNNLLSYVSQYVDIPFDWKGLGEHMTIAFKQELPPHLKKDLDEVVSLTVKSIGISDDAIAVEVEGYPSQKEIPHITVAIPPEGRPVNSNNIKDWQPVEGQLIVKGKVSEIRT